ncbi:MAG: argininosuccinate lyase [Candidatus Omnitrophica bacterium]|nr:argininosuccinate lyase [Candidatus Omnitrophota bacterium]
MSTQRKLWGGRFTKKTDPMVERFTSSISVDYRLAKYDVIGSMAHAKMLGKCRIIPSSDSQKLVKGLTRILRSIEAGRWPAPARGGPGTLDAGAEDIHTQIQQQLARGIGPVAKKLHTARSRNDQVSLDLRLYARSAVANLMGRIQEVQRALVSMAHKHVEVVIPGYTHLQQAQPVLLAHHLLAYVEMLERDRARLADARARIDVLPLGSGALAGTSWPIDRRYVAKLLGFSQVSDNSMDAVSDRDFALEVVSALAVLAMHLSRFSEDLILWSTAEFGIAALDDAFATGSSLMPQKKNPDVLELIRGQAGLIIGNLTGFLTMMKGLPLTYNRDLQWDKRFVFESVEASDDALTVLARLVYHVRIRRSSAARLLASDTLCATDLAEYLVKKGEPFATAHEIVGRIVAAAESQGNALRDFRWAQLQRFSPRFGRDALAVMDPAQSVNRKRSLGSTNPQMVRQAIARWRKTLT